MRILRPFFSLAIHIVPVRPRRSGTIAVNCVLAYATARQESNTLQQQIGISKLGVKSTSCQFGLRLQNLLRLPTGSPLAHVASPPQRRTPFRHTYTAPFILTASHPTAGLHATPGAQQTAREKTRAQARRDCSTACESKYSHNRKGKVLFFVFLVHRVKKNKNYSLVMCLKQICTAELRFCVRRDV